MSKKKDSKKKKQEDEDDSTSQIMKFYRRKLEALNVPICKNFREKVEQALDNQEHLKAFHHFEILGPQGVRAIMEGLCEIGYKHLEDLKLVKVQAQDEGARAICSYIEKSKSIKMLNLPNNEITIIGCDFLGKALAPDKCGPIKKLKLDYNNIGTEGLRMLAQGLAQNPTLERLSLQYCNIDSNGSKYLQEILGFIDSQLWSLKLSGNFLRNEGVYQLFRAMETNNVVEKLVLRNNQFGESEDIPVILSICDVLTKNQCCQWFDFDQNGIYDDAAKKILECVRNYKQIYRMFLPTEMSKEIQDELKKILKKRKKRKKKKKKKGKKKKKK